jgi:hypothetical protein
MADVDSVTCPECGDVHKHVREDAEAEAAEVISSADVRIAEIQAKRDITLARIAAGQFRDEIVVEAAVETAKAEAVMDTVEDLTAEPEPPEIPAPVVIQNQEEDRDDDVPEPPDSEEHHRTAKPRGLGMWN